MRKRILSLLLCIVMCLSLMPMMAFATSSESYYYWSNDNDMVKHDSAPTDDRGYAYYDGNTSIVLNNFQYNYSKIGEDYALFDVTGDRPSITVTLIGNSNIEQSGSGCIYFVKFDKNIEITSEDAATLNITGRSTSNTYEVIYGVYNTTATATVSGKATVNISCTGYGYKQNSTYVGGIAFLLKNLILKDSASISVFGDFGSVARRWKHDSVLKFAEGYNATVKMGDSEDSAISYEVPESGLTVSGCYLSVTPNVPVTPYPVWVSGEQVTEANKTDILGDGKVSYNPNTQTLTVLDGTNINTPHYIESQATALIYAEGIDLTISAPNGLTLKNNAAGDGIIVLNGDLTINGDVNITISGDGADAIYLTTGSVNIGGNVTVQFSGAETESGDDAIAANKDIAITGDVTISGFRYGLYASNGDITVNGTAEIETASVAICAYGVNGIKVGKDVTVTVSENSFDAIYATTGSVNIGGNVTVQFSGAETESGDDAIAANKDIAITGDLEITGFHYGLYASNGDITVNGNAEIETVSYAMSCYGEKGIDVGKDLTVTVSENSVDAICANGGSVTVGGNATVQFNGAETENGDDAISAVEDIAIAGDLEITGFRYGLHAINGNITVNSNAAIEAKDEAIYAGTGKVVMVSGKWDINGGKIAIRATGGIEIPDTHAIITPEGGRIDTETAEETWTYYTVVKTDGTVAEHAVIEPKAASGIYTVTFNANGGSVTPISAVTGTDGKLASSLPTPTRSGSYRFDGWYTAANGGAKVTVDNVYTADTTIYAHWTYTGGGVTYYTLTFNTNGGSAISSVSGTYGKVIDLDKYVPTKSGFDFGGWYSDSALTTPVDEIKLNGNKTVYAKWIEKSAVFPFTDVKETDWSYDDIYYVWEKGLMQGTSETTFAPKTNTSRAMIVTILWRLEGEPVVNYAMSFDDVADGQWYTEAIRWAQANNIVNGYSAEKFGPTDLITREQMAAILYRYAQSKGEGFTGSWMFPLDFEDAADVSDWANEAMHWCVMKGLINGVGSDLLDPQGYATREQVAAILHRFCENIVK